MNDGDRLRQAIIDAPEDDAVRLVYADWLEEDGQEDRAEYVRYGVANAQVCDTHEFGDAFLVCPLHSWPDSLRSIAGKPFLLKPTWSRGFVCAVRCRLRSWLAHGPAVCALHPIQKVVFSEGPINVEPHDDIRRPGFNLNFPWKALEGCDLIAAHAVLAAASQEIRRHAALLMAKAASLPAEERGRAFINAHVDSISLGLLSGPVAWARAQAAPVAAGGTP